MRSLVLSTLYALTILYAFYTLISMFSSSKPTTLTESRDCITRRSKDIKSDESLWSLFPEMVNECSAQDKYDLQGFSNSDELKFHVMPRKKAFGGTNKCTIISLGIGKDVEAERSMRHAMPACSFFGADPVNDTNADIFPEVGKFFNIAVGAENGSFRSYVLEDIYRYQEVKYVDLATFVKKEVKTNVVDQLMVDIEHAEYPVLPFFLKNGLLAKNDITVCQMNIEIHRPNEKQMGQFASWFKEIMRERQWAFMSTSTIIGHLRLYMVNNGSEECRRRYFGDDTKMVKSQEETEEDRDESQL